MKGFDHILNWRLLRGSHEAAVVAAGFEYRRVYTVQDMPSCFSRPICQFAMFLNDQADNEVRQRLLPFVMRLACADTKEVEQQRQRYISSKMTPFTSTSKGIEVRRARLPSDDKLIQSLSRWWKKGCRLFGRR